MAPPNIFINFVCLGEGGTLSWQVGSSDRFSTSTGSFIVQNFTNGALENSTLLVRAKVDVNSTMATCYVTSSSKTVNASSVIIVASKYCITTLRSISLA